MKLIVGLGNPGNEYKNTRHNIGYIILDKYLGNNIKWKNKFDGDYYETKIENEKVIFLKPTTYMNLSGNSVIKYVNYYKIDHNDILIIQDDLDLPINKYRLKYKSSSGGHNGIKSIINCLGTNEIPRLKIGISNNKNINTKDYVLSSISQSDIKELEKTSEKYKEIINDFIKNDINECMSKYNTK